MRMCKDHWDKLKAEVERRGLTKFIARDGEEAAKRTVGEYSEEARNFDPLMGAHNMIVSAALEKLGLDLLIANESGPDKCPLCELQAAHVAHCTIEGCTFTYEATWIPGPVEAAYQQAVKLGLVTSDN